MAKQNGSIRVIVTQDDIDNATRNNAYRCPIALALARQFGLEAPDDGGYSNEYAVYSAHLTIPGASWIGLPDEAVEFIERFDRGEAVAPFSFKVQRG